MTCHICGRAVSIDELGPKCECAEEIEDLRAEFNRINVRDPKLMKKCRGYVNAEHGLVVDMQDGTGRTGLYVETGFLRNLLNRNEELEAFRLAHIGEPPLSEVDAENDRLRERVAKLEADVLRLHKIAAHVPGGVYIKAKEAAGFGTPIKTQEPS